MEEQKELKMVGEWHTDSPVKSLCVMADGVHVCSGSFDGSVHMWDIQVKVRNIILNFFCFFL
jgi:WD40 repeat protein